MPGQNPYRYTGDPTMAFAGPTVPPAPFDVGPMPRVPGLSSSGKRFGAPAGPKPIPSDLEQEQLDADTERESFLLQRLRALGLSAGDVDKVTPTWGRGFMAHGQTGDAAPVSSTTRFGTATFAPGTFVIGAEDPSRREFLTQQGVAQSERSRRELSDFLSINAPTGTRDNYGTTDPMQDSRIRAGRAEAAAKANALNPLPGITVDDPMEVERAGGQAAFNAQKLAEARLAAQASPVGREVQDMATRSKALESAAGPAMSIDAGQDARNAFLEFLFGIKQQGATPDDIQRIMAAVNTGGVKVSEEEVRQALAAMTGGR